MRKGLIAALFTVAVCLGVSGPVLASTGVNVDTHTETEIRAYFEENNVTWNGTTEYEVEPDYTTAPYEPGRLSQSTLDSALATLNSVRYIAGLQSVSLNDSYNEMEQAGTLVNAVNGVMSHYPEQPEGMSNELYNLGYSGTSQGNIGMGYTDLNSAIINGWMYDGNANNISRVGHRRWILNPTMLETGFGLVNRSTAMYAFDRNNTGASDTGVIWPAQIMPTEYFGSSYPWSYSYGQTLNEAEVSVQLVRSSDGNTWNFSAEASDGDFYINNDYYGQPGCIIFRPNNITSYTAGESYAVTIYQGDSLLAEYTVDFFSLETVESFTLANANRNLTAGSIGSNYQLFVQNLVPATAVTEYTWTVSDESVASISFPYTTTRIVLVDILACGETTITATSTNGGVSVDATLQVAHTPVTDPAVEATETSTGLTEGSHCSVCNKVLVAQEEIPKLPSTEKSFTDVKEGAYYYDAVQWAVANNITSGKSETVFGSNDTCTRAQVVTFLWNAAGKPEPESTTNPFSDVSSGAYYLKAVLWATEQGITSGVSDTQFSPNTTVTRAQVVTFLWNAAGKPEPTTATNNFKDVSSSAYYYNAVLWAAENGVTSGLNATTFGTKKECTRAQVVTFMHNAE